MARRDENGFTRIQGEIVRLLSDGLDHERAELRNLIKPSGPSALAPHLAEIRKVVRKQGMDVVCTLKQRKIHYRMVRNLTNPYKN